MAAVKLSAQDCKDLEKYLRYFVYKSAQIIVQSRLGERVVLPSKQFATGADWFNLSINDDSDVLSEVKQVYPGSRGGLAGGDVVCVDTLLRTSSGGAMLLENWTMKLVSPCDNTVRISFTVYNRIGILLKSLFIASRSVPAYQLCRRCISKAREFGIYYRVYVGQPALDVGHLFSCRTVGQVPTPVGTVHLAVAYRTQLSFESNSASLSDDLELRDDHFCVDKSPVAGIQLSGWHAVSKWQQFDDADAAGDDELLSTSPPDHNRRVSIPSGLNQIAEDARGARSDSRPRVAAFASSDRPAPHYFDFDMDATFPFGRLLERDAPKATDKYSDEKLVERDVRMADGIEPVVLLANTGSSSLPLRNRCGLAADVAGALKTPFASCTAASGKAEQEGDLGRFYRECQSAPSLSMFQQPPADVHELLNSITDQLAQFEANAKEFDEFVNSFQES